MSDREWRIKILSEVYDMPREDIKEALDFVEHAVHGAIGFLIVSTTLQCLPHKDSASLMRVLIQLQEVAEGVENKVAWAKGKEALKLTLEFVTRVLSSSFCDLPLSVALHAEQEGGEDE